MARRAGYSSTRPGRQGLPGHRTEVQVAGLRSTLLLHLPYEACTEAFADAVGKQQAVDYDVAEVFIGADFDQIWRYREFEFRRKTSGSIWTSTAAPRRRP